MIGTGVFVNGCFDVLHVGHLRMLRFAGWFGPVTVAVNTDASIRELKGPDRPINTLAERVEMLRALTCVHDVLVFESDTPILLLKGLYARGDGPRWVVKGDEYRHKPIPERAIIEANGGEILFAPTTPGKSTTEILRRQT